MDPIDQEIAALEAKKVYLEAAKAFRAAKAKNKGNGKTLEDYRTTKTDLQEKRAAWRVLRVSPNGPGDGVANPSAITAGTNVSTPG